MIYKAVNCSFSYDDRPLFSGVSFGLEKGQVLSVIGPNGVGKTTLLKCIMNIFEWTDGISELLDISINKVQFKDFWKKVAYVPQSKPAAVTYTAKEMIMLGRSSYISTFSQPKQSDYEMVLQTMNCLDIEGLKDMQCNRLSGGQMQMVLIARALVGQPELLIMDEPESNLDYANQELVLRTIERISKNITCIVNTHYPDHALRIAQKALLLYKDGSNIYGDSAKVITEDNLNRLYGVQVKICSIKVGKTDMSVVLPIR